MSKARMIKKYFDITLDAIVVDDNKIYETRIKYNGEMKDTNGNLLNNFTIYCKFTNGDLFSTLRTYKNKVLF